MREKATKKGAHLSQTGPHLCKIEYFANGASGKFQTAEWACWLAWGVRAATDAGCRDARPQLPRCVRLSHRRAIR